MLSSSKLTNEIKKFAELTNSSWFLCPVYSPVWANNKYLDQSNKIRNLTIHWLIWNGWHPPFVILGVQRVRTSCFNACWDWRLWGKEKEILTIDTSWQREFRALIVHEAKQVWDRKFQCFPHHKGYHCTIQDIYLQ